MMKQFLPTLVLFLLALCARANALDGIVPRPMQIEQHKGSLHVRGITVRCDPAFDARTRDAVSTFAAKLGYISGKTCTYSAPLGLQQALAGGKLKGIVFLHDTSLEPEAYTLLVTPANAVVRACGLNGVLYALATLRQMLPAAIYGDSIAE